MGALISSLETEYTNGLCATLSNSFRLSDQEFRPNDHNLYFLFGLNSSATHKQIKAAYRRLTRKYHPDFHYGDKLFQNAFAIINSIYAILSDDSKRADYDKIYRRKKIVMATVNYNYYNQADFNENLYTLIPEGPHRVRIEEAKETVSHSGKDMIVLTLAVSGYNSKLWGYIILDDASPEAVKKTNQALGTVFNSFNIPHGDFELDHWIGKVGGVMVNHRETVGGNKRANVRFFLYRNQVDKLPAWGSDVQNSNNQEAVNPDMVDFDFSNNSGIPF